MPVLRQARVSDHGTIVACVQQWSDMFNLVLRPNPALAPRSVYETKAARWREQWPELRVMDWPATSSATVAAEGVQQRNTATTRTDPVR
ncbi:MULTISPECIES: nucleotidyltransferase family protein [unclassified Streptomyces]|uniref:nucleotidyltransferase family protein n=1 Tax=unclassified Streptomyces TaxID=2593676 RepID=UPI003D89D214